MRLSLEKKKNNNNNNNKRSRFNRVLCTIGARSLMNVFVLLNTKKDILKNVGNRAVPGHH